MKRIVKVFFILVLAIILTGCKKQTVIKCSLNSDSESGYKIESNFKIIAVEDGVTKVETTEVIKSDNKTILSYFEKQLKEQYKEYNKEYKGYTYSIVNKDGKVTSNVTIDYNKMDLTKFANDNPAIKEYINKNNKISIKGIKTMYKSLGATCNK